MTEWRISNHWQFYLLPFPDYCQKEYTTIASVKEGNIRPANLAIGTTVTPDFAASTVATTKEERSPIVTMSQLTQQDQQLQIALTTTSYYHFY